MDHISEGLCNPLGEPSFSPTGCLVTALNAALAMGGEASLQVGARMLTVTAESFNHSEADHTDYPRLELRLPSDKRDLGHERKALLTRCRYLPVPLLLNHRPLKLDEPLPAHSTRGFSPHLEGHFVLAELRPKSHGGRPLNLPPLTRLEAGQVQLYRREDILITRADQADGQSDRWLLLRASLAEEAELHLLQGGVWVDTKRVASPVAGVQAILQVDHLKTDLTGFQVLENDSFRQAVEALRPDLEQLRKLGLGALQSLDATREPVAVDSHIRTGVGCLAALLSLVWIVYCFSRMYDGGGWILAGFAAPLLAAASIYVGGQVVNLAHPSKVSNRSLRQQIRARLTQGTSVRRPPASSR